MKQMVGMSGKEFMLNLLNGMSLGIVLVLMPGAIFGELLKLVVPILPQVGALIIMLKFVASLMPAAIGVAVGYQFKLTPIQTLSVAMTAVIGSGVMTVNEAGGYLFAGTGDVINTGITTALAVILVKVIKDKLGAYNMLALPSLLIVVAGGIGMLTLNPVKNISMMIGQGVMTVTELQPILMGSLLAMIFAVLIVSPISTVAIATAIGLAGVGSGTANLGIVAAGVGLAIAGWSVNNTGTSLAHVIGSPKIQMANTMKKPLTMVPVLCNAAILGALGGWLNIQGTPTSAGFGLSGLLGPLTALNAAGGFTVPNMLVILLLFAVLPVVLGLLFQKVFTTLIRIVDPIDYKISFE
ncbi:PTS transporter subunit IIC [Jeotgalibaca caeni]|uniref:PTS transporter subunit IIC n=1 Tax=Jeotgalibaca caeni TaxID=3028623 RepID=UPI00237D85E9|nr:PTS sugar transporter subunit IIC [Jeotgalibaca caeni]MDE1549800.1 PTS sugar transporter subunit IIC [Jeotgalibaca caeni]